MATKEREVAAPGDVIEVTGRRVGDTARSGEILEVLGTAERPHYRVHWDDGHETVFFPGSDTVVRHEPAVPRPELEAGRRAEHPRRAPTRRRTSSSSCCRIAAR